MSAVAVTSFRTVFAFNAVVNWFPGHMAKTARLMRENLKNIDIVVEVRDARIPFSSENTAMEEVFKSNTKSRLIVFNKSDLANHRLQKNEIKGCASLWAIAPPPTTTQGILPL